VARLNPANVELAREIIARYPRSRSALIPLLHLAQEQDGWVTEEAMDHIAELLGLTAAEVLGTCSFYEMFKREPVGRYLINVCNGISCMLLGSHELIEHAEQTLGVNTGGTTDDGMITLEAVECIASCDGAPCLAVNYRFVNDVSHAGFNELITELRSGERSDEFPPHGTTARVRQTIAADRWAGKGGDGLPKVWVQ
jgi:NADH-quinone oxidoreductase subunit E